MKNLFFGLLVLSILETAFADDPKCYVRANTGWYTVMQDMGDHQPKNEVQSFADPFSAAALRDNLISAGACVAPTIAPACLIYVSNGWFLVKQDDREIERFADINLAQQLLETVVSANVCTKPETTIHCSIVSNHGWYVVKQGIYEARNFSDLANARAFRDDLKNRGLCL